MLSDHALRLFLNAAEREERDMSDRRALAEPARHERALTANLLYLHQRIIEIRLEENRRVDGVPPTVRTRTHGRENGGVPGGTAAIGSTRRSFRTFR